MMGGDSMHMMIQQQQKWWGVTDSEELVALLLERNADHLRQITTDGTPFSNNLTKWLFGLYGTSYNTDKVL